MIIFWRGWGLVTIPLVGCVIFSGLFGAVWLTETLQLPDLTKTLDLAAVFLLAGVLNWMLGRYLNNKGKPVVLHDEKTGRPLTKVEHRHALFFIKMEYWSVPLFLISALFLASAFYA